MQSPMTEQHHYGLSANRVEASSRLSRNKRLTTIKGTTMGDGREAVWKTRDSVEDRGAEVDER